MEGVGRAARLRAVTEVLGRAAVWPFEFVLGVGIAGAVTLIMLGVIAYTSTRSRRRYP